MLVRVTQRGFLYWIRHPGEIIDIAENFFSKEWMEKVDGKAVPTVEPAATAQPQSTTDEPDKLQSPGAPTTMKIA